MFHLSPFILTTVLAGKQYWKMFFWRENGFQNVSWRETSLKCPLAGKMLKVSFRTLNSNHPVACIIKIF
jgi:hypothetical protein